MSIAVIIPSFNRVAYLIRALASVFSQSFPAEEVIVIDDGSSDNTKRVCQRHFPSVDYLKINNAGVSFARNIGIMQSSSRYIAFLDSDDLWLPNKLKMQIETVTKNQAKLCHSNEIWIRHGVRVNAMNKHQKRGGWIYQYCLPMCRISPSSVLIDRDIFKGVGLFNTNLPACEDYDLWLRITARYPVEYIDEPLIVKYGGHDDQLSKQFWGMDRFRIQALCDILDAKVLKEDDKAATLAMLAKKIGVYLAGARKREKWQEVAYYESIQRKYFEIALGSRQSYGSEIIY